MDDEILMNPELPESPLTDNPEPEQPAPVPEPPAKKAASKKKPEPKKAAKPAKKPEKELKGLSVVSQSTVKVSDIVLPNDWNREKLGNISALVQSIRLLGQITAVTVMPVDDKPGKYLLLDGRCRFAALQELKIPTIAVSVLGKMSDTERRSRALAANMTQRPNNPYEVALECEFLATQGLTHKEIALCVGGKSEGYVSQHRGILKLPNNVQKAIRDGKLPPTVARVLLRLDPEEHAAMYAKVVDALLGGETTVEDASNMIDVYIAKCEVKSGSKKSAEKGASAKTRAEAKLKGPSVKLPDYSEPDYVKQMVLRPKADLQAGLIATADKLGRTSNPTKRAEFRGILKGIEFAASFRDI